MSAFLNIEVDAVQHGAGTPTAKGIPLKKNNFLHPKYK
jgi:hypothetical protein